MSSGCRKTAIFLGIGCLAIPIGIAVIVAAAMFWARSVHDKEGPRRPETTTLDLPVGPAVEPGRDLQGATPAPAPNMPPPHLALSIDLAEGEFHIEPGPPGSDLKVEGYFDPRDYELTQVTDDGSDGKSIRVRFRRKRSMLLMLLSMNHKNTNRVTVHIPQGVPTSLNLRLSRCQSRTELGGLLLTDLQAGLSMGDQKLNFERPLAAELPQAHLRASMGDITISNLGNARAKEVTFHASMGDIKTDFDGEWEPGFVTNAHLRSSMGDFRVRVPASVRLKSSNTVFLGDSRTRGVKKDQPEDPNAPVLNLEMSTSMGDVSLSQD